MYRDIKISWSKFFWLVVLLGLTLFSSAVDASLPCGDVIAPEGWESWSGSSRPLINTPIANCTNPFSTTAGVTSPYTLTIEGVTVVNNDQITIPPDGTKTYGITGYNYHTTVNHLLFLHDGNNYQYTNIDKQLPTETDFRRLATEFFAPEIDIEPYITALLSDNPWNYFPDGPKQDLLFDFDDYIYEHPILPVLLPGTYTLVSKEYPIYSSQLKLNWYQRIFAILSPIAHAQSYEIITHTLTFTLIEDTPEPTGASSVLFLPGIMGSRLYEESDACFGSGEQERWFSMGDCDQLRLLTKVDGTSVNDIYIKNVDSTVIEETIGFNLYKEFIKQMDELEKEKVVADFIPFAYDWRLRLDDILKTKLDLNTNEVRYDVSTPLTESHLYKTVAEMVKNSYSGKVTIVAHSNGGLVAKAFLSSLQSTNDPLLKKIDNLILVASPQVGTPDSVVSMLHGSEIGGGFVVSQEMVRKLLNTAPFGYHLLPNKNYFTGTGVEVKTPVIVINDGLITNSWIEQFGGNIDSTEELYTFLSRDSGRVKPAEDDLLLPETVDNYLLNYANTVADIVNNWVPSDDIKVYQIAGTGVETPTGITYFTDKECIRGGKLWFECAEYKPKLGYYINFTFDGDQTVVVPSALAMAESDNVERWWLDLFEFADDTGGINVHKNILEVPAVINFTKNIIQSTTSLSTRYLSDTIVTPEIGKRLSFFLHSPLDMYIKSKEGITSSSTNEIPGAIYKRYGEVQYVSLPAETSDVILYLRGSQEGSFTLVVEEWDGNIKTNTYDFQAIPSGTSTLASLSLNDFSQNSELRIDFDNNGVIDGVVSAATDTIEISDIVSEEKEVVVTDKNTYTSKRSRIRKNIPPGQVAGIAIINTEEWYYGEMFRLLKELSRVLSLLEKIGYEK